MLEPHHSMCIMKVCPLILVFLDTLSISTTRTHVLSITYCWTLHLQTNLHF